MVEEEVVVDETKLRRVSITTNSILFCERGNTFEVNEKVMELLLMMRNKYRVFLITQVAACDAPDHLKAKEVL